MRIPIKDVRDLATKRGLSHCIIFAFDGKHQHVATYGRTIDDCAQAAAFGNALKKELGWPDSLTAQPARVRRLQERIKVLEQEVARLEAEMRGAG